MPVPGIDVPGLGCGLALLREDKVLLYRRLQAPEAGSWNIVGGKVDHMERAKDAARREAEEESGLAIGAVDFLCISEQIIAEERQHWLSLIYVCRDFSGEARVVEPEKLPEFGWFPLDALPAPLSRFAADAVEALRRRQG
ncbi:NUDIX domain-containing protein [Shinella sp. CPCC 101442]|uniref:NUDIX domain-containing protein n=1 Tax=Shinella sp. CPCC 101442 TaxID=2932265 RepID=UPI0021538137|nr:NUDIX domain-containing protein [Shinella sp. CPCC 101442]MCR6499570.1 NUDIX domain-containing protein [Shinella sp. CPCC 101442]